MGTPTKTIHRALMARPQTVSPNLISKRFPWWIWLLAVLTLLSRLLFTSTPYFVDGPNHVAAIVSGTMMIQPPGYFLFAELGKLVALSTHCSPASALLAINITFSVLGVIAFACLCIRLVPEYLSVALSFVYAFTVAVWFVAEIHSTYAAMTFFAPALLYFMLAEENWWMVGGLWATMTGFRPSDGIFILPLILFFLIKRKIRSATAFICTALPLVALWYFPTMRHFGGRLLSPVSSSGGWAHILANGLLIPGVSWQRKVGNLVHLMFAFFNAWNILTPFLLVGLFSKNVISRYALLWMLPGLLFFSLYFFSDSLYLAYMIAPGFLLAAEGLRRIGKRAGVITVLSGLLISITQMTVARPIQPTTLPRAVVDAYYLVYTGWSLKHHYGERLRDAAGALHIKGS